MGLPGEVALVVEKYMIQVEFLCQTPRLLPLFSITAGGSAGPEAPWPQINGFGGWLGELKLTLLQPCADLQVAGAALGASLVRPLVASLPWTPPSPRTGILRSDNPSRFERDSVRVSI